MVLGESDLFQFSINENIIVGHQKQMNKSIDRSDKENTCMEMSRNDSDSDKLKNQSSQSSMKSSQSVIEELSESLVQSTPEIDYDSNLFSGFVRVSFHYYQK